VGDGDGDQDAEPGPLASSTDATGRDAKHAKRSAPSSNATIAFGEEFLYELKTGLSGGLRPPSGRQRHGGHRGASLTLPTREASAVTCLPRGLLLRWTMGLLKRGK
jgi:hypothetical protein